MMLFGLMLLNMLPVTWKLLNPKAFSPCFVSGSYKIGKNILKIAFKRLVSRIISGKDFSCFIWIGIFVKMYFDGRSASSANV